MIFYLKLFGYFRKHYLNFININRTYLLEVFLNITNINSSGLLDFFRICNIFIVAILMLACYLCLVIHKT